jgi:outer membrane protein TolC
MTNRSDAVTLNAELTWRKAAIALNQARANRYIDNVALFQALDGWWHRQDASDVAAASAASSGQH